MVTTKDYGYLTLPQLDNIQPWKKERKKSTGNGPIFTQLTKENIMSNLGVPKTIGKISDVRICS